MSYDPSEAWMEEGLQQLWEDWYPEFKEDLKTTRLQNYFLANPEVHKKVLKLHTKANELKDHDFPSVSLVVSYTAIECTLRDLIFYPLLSGSFIEGKIAAVLTENFLRDTSEKTEKARNQLLKAITSIELYGVSREARGASLWEEIKELRVKRNKVVHDGREYNSSVAGDAIQIAECLYSKVFCPMLASIGLGISSDSKIMEKSKIDYLELMGSQGS